MALAKVFIALANIFKPLANVFIALANIFKPLANVFIALANIFKPLAKVFIALANIFRPLANVFIALANVFIALANVFIALAKVNCGYGWHIAVSSALCIKDILKAYGQCRFCNGNVLIISFSFGEGARRAGEVRKRFGDRKIRNKQ